MRRWRVTRLVLIVLAGAIVSVAVAWGFEMLHRPSQFHELSLAEAEAIVFASGPPAESHRDHHSQYRRLGSTLTKVSTRSLQPRPKDGYVGAQYLARQSGWPSLALVGWTRHAAEGSVTSSWCFTWTRRIEPSILSFHMFPCKPIWPGFAINTIFYAAVLWMLLVFPFVMRRRGRIKHGLCPACAYPIGTSDVCTECGAAVTNKSVAQP